LTYGEVSGDLFSQREVDAQIDDALPTVAVAKAKLGAGGARSQRVESDKALPVQQRHFSGGQPSAQPATAGLGCGHLA
jgi:hypothetical protein